MAADKHGRLGILGLFRDRKEYLYATWPRLDKEGNPTGWRPERAAEALMGAAARKGIWRPAGRERGRGAWPGEHGELVIHTGQQVITFAPTPNAWGDRVVREAGVVGRHVYSADEAVGTPPDQAVADTAEPARQTLQLLETWRFRRPAIDPVLLLGWIGAAMIGGALDWRAIVWLTGGRGTGKSTLHDLLDSLFGGTLLKLADASEAHIRQTLSHQTLPVLLDESESEEDNRKLNGLIKLARIAASGGTLGRGGADHQAVEFTMRSAFLFGSILMPPLLGQDRSRITILEMEELATGTLRIDVSRAAWEPLGMQMRRRMFVQWGRWQRTLEWFRIALAGAGHSRRGQDQFGTLLAAADMLLHDGDVDASTGGEWVAQLRAGELSELDDDARDEERCIAHLMQQSVDPFRNGVRKTLADWVRQAAGWTEGEWTQADKVLQTYGLRVRAPVGGEPVLFVANTHPALAALFAGTHWATRSGAAGVWVQSLRRLPGATRTAVVYYAGTTGRGTWVPLALAVQRTDPDPDRVLI